MNDLYINLIINKRKTEIRYVETTKYLSIVKKGKIILSEFTYSKPYVSTTKKEKIETEDAPYIYNPYEASGNEISKDFYARELKIGKKSIKKDNQGFYYVKKNNDNYYYLIKTEIGVEELSKKEQIFRLENLFAYDRSFMLANIIVMEDPDLESFENNKFRNQLLTILELRSNFFQSINKDAFGTNDDIYKFLFIERGEGDE